MSSWGAEVGVMPADRGKNKHKVVAHAACATHWNESPAGCCLHVPLCTKRADRIQDWQFLQCSHGGWDKVPLLTKSSCQAPGTDSKRAATDLSYCLGGIMCSAVMIFWPEHIQQKTHHHWKVNRALRRRKIRYNSPSRCFTVFCDVKNTARKAGNEQAVCAPSPKKCDKGKAGLQSLHNFLHPLFYITILFPCTKEEGLDSSVSWVTKGPRNQCLMSCIPIAGVLSHVTGANLRAKPLAPVAWHGVAAYPTPELHLGVHGAPCLYLPGRVYLGGLMLKRKGVDTFQNWMCASPFLALTFPLLLFLFQLSAARNGLRDNKPISLQHCAYLLVGYLICKCTSSPTAAVTFFSQKVLHTRRAEWSSSYRKGVRGRWRKPVACQPSWYKEPLCLLSLSITMSSRVWIQYYIFWKLLRCIPGKYLLYSYFPKVHMWHWKLESSPTTICSCTKLRRALKKWVSPKGINKQKQSRAFSGSARKWRELAVFYSQPHPSLWTSDWAMYWRWKMTLLDLSCLQRMAVFALKCLSADASLGEKPTPAERTLSPGSAVGRTLKLKRDLHRSSGNTLQFLNPLKVSC